MIRVGFSLIGGGHGTGGYNYLLNLVRLLCEYEANRVRPVLLFGEDIAEADVAPFRMIGGAELALAPVMNRAHKSALLARALLTGRDAAFQRLLEEQRIDLVFESAQFFGWRIGRPAIAWIPDFQHRRLRHMFTWRGYWRRELGFQALMASERTIMLSSEDARRDCEHFYPASRGRTRAIHFAVPPLEPPTLAVARAVADSYGLPRDFFFMPNQLSKHKNHLLVLDALSELSARGRQVVVVSSGKQEDERHPDYFPSVMSRRQALKQEEHFRLLGMIPYPHVRALMRTATALLNPSLFEGWSTPVEEARALGVPLVLSDLDVHREQAADSAHYFDRHSATSLAQALAAVSPISDDERERRLAVARVEAQARVETFARAFATLVCDQVNAASRQTRSA